MPPIAYKLCSLSDLPGLILQVVGTPTHRVLVSVLVLAVVYTRILISDRISACPYRPFSIWNEESDSDTKSVKVRECERVSPLKPTRRSGGRLLASNIWIVTDGAYVIIGHHGYWAVLVFKAGFETAWNFKTLRKVLELFLITRKMPRKVWNLARASQTSYGSGLKVDNCHWMF